MSRQSTRGLTDSGSSNIWTRLSVVQRQRLGELALAEGVPTAEVVRRAIDLYASIELGERARLLAAINVGRGTP